MCNVCIFFKFAPYQMFLFFFFKENTFFLFWPHDYAFHIPVTHKWHIGYINFHQYHCVCRCSKPQRFLVIFSSVWDYSSLGAHKPHAHVLSMYPNMHVVFRRSRLVFCENEVSCLRTSDLPDSWPLSDQHIEQWHWFFPKEQR